MDANPSNHTRKVIWLRRSLIVVAMIAALALIGLSNTQRFAPRNEAGGSFRLSSSGPVIDNPDYQGRTEAGRAYRLTGTLAQTGENNDTYIRTPRLVFAATSDQAEVQINAAMGQLFENDKAILNGKVSLNMSDGHKLQTQELISNLNAQTITAPQNLSIDGPNITMRASSLDGQLDKNIFTLHNVDIRLNRDRTQNLGAKNDKENQ